MTSEDLNIRSLGTCRIKSPLRLSKVEGDKIFNFVEDNDRILFNTDWNDIQESLGRGEEPLTMERAGPREHIYFDPSKTTAAIVTCGGLCPGINNVIRSLVMTLNHRYGVDRILGIQSG